MPPPAPALVRRVPLPTWGLVLMLLPASALLVLILLLPIYTGNGTLLVVTLLACALGSFMHPLLQASRAGAGVWGAPISLPSCSIAGTPPHTRARTCACARASALCHPGLPPAPPTVRAVLPAARLDGV
jgi:hypothetical protein